MEILQNFVAFSEYMNFNLEVKEPPPIKPIDLKSDHLNEANLAKEINAIFWKEYPLFFSDRDCMHFYKKLLSVACLVLFLFHFLCHKNGKDVQK